MVSLSAGQLSVLGSPGVLARGKPMLRFDETQTLATINVLVLVMCGASDIATKPVTSDRMKAEIPYF